MPGYNTHYIFGINLYKKLKNQTIKSNIKKHKQAYIIGLQGADIFFFNPFTLSKKKSNLGSLIHKSDTSLFLNSLKDYSLKLKGNEKEVCLSYYYGFLCHVVLDETTHPYIREKTGYGLSLIDYFEKHITLETEIDTILIRDFSKKQPTKFVKHINRSIPYEDSLLISRMLYKVTKDLFPDYKISFKEFLISLYLTQQVSKKLALKKEAHKQLLLNFVHAFTPSSKTIPLIITDDCYPEFPKDFFHLMDKARNHILNNY